MASGPTAVTGDRYKWEALSNTTAAVFMSALGFATAGMVVFGASFIGLMMLPVDFPCWAFALLTAVNGIGGGMFAAPNSSSIMSSVRPGTVAWHRECARPTRTPARRCRSACSSRS